MPFHLTIVPRRVSLLILPFILSALWLLVDADPTRGGATSPLSIASWIAQGKALECPDLLENGNFEAGSLASWTSSGAVGLDWGRNGTHGVWLGRGDNAFGELRQAVTIPAGANPVRLEYWWLVESLNDQHLDVFTVLVEEAGRAQELRVWRAVGPFGQWRQDVLYLTAYAGRSVSVVFLVRTDTSVPSTFVVDDVTLMACGGTIPTATATRTQTPIATSTQTPTPTATPGASEKQELYLPLLLRTSAPVFVVNTTSDTDDGSCNAVHCSLREAINAARQHDGPETIAFNIPTGDPGRDAEGICTIRPTTALPSLTQGSTTLDGYTQPGARPNSNPVGQPINAALKIVIDGSLIPRDQSPMGLHLSGDGTVVRGLVIYGFYDGIYIPPVANCRIEGCFIGTNAHGATAPGNSSSGIEIYTMGAGVGPWNNTIGGSSHQARNLLSGNGVAGVMITGEGRNTIQGNYIGTDATGQRSLPNRGGGVVIVGSHYNLIGGTESGAANLIAHNGWHGVAIYGQLAAANNTITRNRIHTNDQKGIALANGGNNGLAAPVITSASRTLVSGTACANCTVEVFSDAADEGATYEGTTTANANGQWSLSKPAGFSGPNLTATATDSNGNTSEFSAPFILPS